MASKFEKAMQKTVEGLAEANMAIREDVNRHEKILEEHAKSIAQLQKDVMEMRNRAIASEAKNRVPYKEISQRYGISEGRVTQIKHKYN